MTRPAAGEQFDWTPERIRRLARMISQNLSAPVIAERLGAPVEGVRIKKKRLKLAKPRGPWRAWKPTEYAVLREDITQREMARKLNRTLSAVKHRIGLLRVAGKLPKPERRVRFVEIGRIGL